MAQPHIAMTVGFLKNWELARLYNIPYTEQVRGYYLPRRQNLPSASQMVAMQSCGSFAY